MTKQNPQEQEKKKRGLFKKKNEKQRTNEPIMITPNTQNFMKNQKIHPKDHRKPRSQNPYQINKNSKNPYQIQFNHIGGC